MKNLVIALLVLLGYAIAQNAAADSSSDNTAAALRQLDLSFRQLDADHDGRVSRREARAEKGLLKSFGDADLDRDNSLTAFEYELLHFQPEEKTALVRR